jgi:hypothetical protein
LTSDQEVYSFHLETDVQFLIIWYLSIITFAELLELRERFEQDKKRLAELRASRKFNPVS